MIAKAVAQGAFGDGLLPDLAMELRDFSMVDRATHTVPASAAPTKNGICQPQLARSASLIDATVSADTPTASNAPTSLAAEAE